MYDQKEKTPVDAGQQALAIHERLVRHEDPLVRYLAHTVGLHHKIRKIHSHQQETASSLLRAAAALRSIALARQQARSAVAV